MIFMWKSMVSCKCSLKPIQSMVIHDLDDEFWGMTWKPPFEWRNTYHTRAEQDHTIHWFYGQNPQFKYRPSVKLLDIGTCNTLARTLGHCPRESKQVSQMSNDFFGRKTDMDSIYIYMDFYGLIWILHGFIWILHGFSMDSTWILYGFIWTYKWFFRNIYNCCLLIPGVPGDLSSFPRQWSKIFTEPKPNQFQELIVYIYIYIYVYVHI